MILGHPWRQEAQVKRAVQKQLSSCRNRHAWGVEKDGAVQATHAEGDLWAVQARQSEEDLRKGVEIEQLRNDLSAVRAEHAEEDLRKGAEIEQLQNDLSAVRAEHAEEDLRKGAEIEQLQNDLSAVRAEHAQEDRWKGVETEQLRNDLSAVRAEHAEEDLRKGAEIEQLRNDLSAVRAEHAEEDLRKGAEIEQLQNDLSAVRAEHAEEDLRKGAEIEQLRKNISAVRAEQEDLKVQASQFAEERRILLQISSCQVTALLNMQKGHDDARADDGCERRKSREIAEKGPTETTTKHDRSAGCDQVVHGSQNGAAALTCASGNRSTLPADDVSSDASWEHVADALVSDAETDGWSSSITVGSSGTRCYLTEALFRAENGDLVPAKKLHQGSKVLAADNSILEVAFPPRATCGSRNGANPRWSCHPPRDP